MASLLMCILHPAHYLYTILYLTAYRYLAGGLGSWDVRDQSWNWLVHLDLTTDRAQFKALIHSTPTVADLDGDGRLATMI